jgi:hypothetical protein
MSKKKTVRVSVVSVDTDWMATFMVVTFCTTYRYYCTVESRKYQFFPRAHPYKLSKVSQIDGCAGPHGFFLLQRRKKKELRPDRRATLLKRDLVTA